MSTHVRVHVSRVLAIGAVLALAVSCGAPPPATTETTEATPAPVAATSATTAAQTVAPTTAPIAAPGIQIVSHKVGTTHTKIPKRIEVPYEIDMYDHYFANTLGEKNPVFTLPVGKVVGLHFHNEGGIMHEFEIGQKHKEGGGYERSLFDLVKADVFFYYGDVKSEVGGANFEEIEVEQGIQDVWLRFTVPAELKGEWEIGCFAPDHYEKGMKATVIFK